MAAPSSAAPAVMPSDSRRPARRIVVLQRSARKLTSSFGARPRADQPLERLDQPQRSRTLSFCAS